MLATQRPPSPCVTPACRAAAQAGVNQSASYARPGSRQTPSPVRQALSLRHKVALGQEGLALPHPSPRGSNSLALGNAQGELNEHASSALKAHDRRCPGRAPPLGALRCFAPSARKRPSGGLVFMGRCPMLHCASPSGCIPRPSRPPCPALLVGHGQDKLTGVKAGVSA